jgi:hypothetical protein
MSSADISKKKKKSAPVELESPEGRVNAAGKVHDKVPGRMRVRLKPELRNPDDMAKLQKSLDANPDVHHVRVSERTGSVTFTHGAHKDGYSIFEKALKEAELLAEVAFEVPSSEEGGEDPYGKLDRQLADLVYTADAWVYRKTGLRFRGQILAGGIAGLGVAQMAFYGISLEMVPGPILLWIGWDIYHRVAKEPPFPAETASAAEVVASEPSAVEGLPATA